MLRVDDHTISKVGSKRRRLPNGLLQIIERAELAGQFKLYGTILDRWSRGRPVTFVPIMHGAGYTWQRLMGHMAEGSQHIERVIVAQSYGDGQIAVPVRIYGDWIIPDRDIRDRDIVLIDDILDSGVTMATAIEFVERYQPRSIHTLFLLRKDRRQEAHIDPTWVMFDIDDCWVVGAGLDDGGKFRHLRYLAEKPKGGD